MSDQPTPDPAVTLTEEHLDQVHDAVTLTEDNVTAAVALWLCDIFEDEDGLGCEPEAGPPCVGHFTEACVSLDHFLAARLAERTPAPDPAGVAEVLAPLVAEASGCVFDPQGLCASCRERADRFAAALAALAAAGQGTAQPEVDWQATHRDLTRRLGFGDNITEPQADNDTIVAWFDEQNRDAAEWREHERFRDECSLAGHPEDEECEEHGPTCCNRTHLAQPAPEQQACRCGDCIRPEFGPNTDGEPCPWCRDCGCSEEWHQPAPATDDETLAAQVLALADEWDRADLNLPTYEGEPAYDTGFRAGYFAAAETARNELRALVAAQQPAPAPAEGGSRG